MSVEHNCKNKKNKKKIAKHKLLELELQLEIDNSYSTRARVEDF